MHDKFIKLCCNNNAVTLIQRRRFSNYTNIAREYKYNYKALFKQIYKLIKFFFKKILILLILIPYY
jgi:hypothetical protein